MYSCFVRIVFGVVLTTLRADDASDDAQSQLSADLAEDDDDAAGSCYSCSVADNQSLVSAADETGAQCHAPAQLPSPHHLIPDQYTVETLLANVQALLKLAMDGVRHREQQANIKAGQSSCPHQLLGETHISLRYFITLNTDLLHF